MSRHNRCARFILAVLPALLTGSADAETVFPSDAVVNVRDYGAIPSDEQDDTAAIQKAITENVGTGRTIYFPMGRYDISDTLVAKDKNGRWEAHLTLRGQQSERTLLRLQNQNPAFGDPAKPKPLIMTGSHWNEGDPLEPGGGNKAFRNNIRDLTIHTGIGNPGAIGIEWANSNQGTIRDVVVRNRDGVGHTGIAMNRAIPGPGYIRNVAIRGFETGLSVNDIQYGVTLEKISLMTSKTGIRIGQNVIYGLEVEAEINGVESHDPNSMAVMLYSNLNTGLFDALKLRGHGLIRDDFNPKYRDTTTFAPGQPPRTAGRNSDEAYALLRIADAPVYWNDKLDQWAAVGARRDGEPDDTAAIQRAFDAGKPVVYFPIRRTYFLGDTVTIRGKVRHVLGMGAEISLGAAEKPFSNREKPRPLFRINPVDGDDVTIEDCFFNAQYPGEVIFENNSPKPLIIKHCMGWIGAGGFRRSYQNTPASFGGKVFIEDCFLPGWRFEKQDVWARQLNPENHESLGKTPQVENIGGKLWILGFKTEGVAPFIHTSAGGKTELLGAYNYISATAAPKVPEDTVPYIVEDSQASLTFVADNFRQDSDYKVYIREIKNGKVVQEVTRDQMPPRNGNPGDRSFAITNWRTK